MLILLAGFAALLAVVAASVVIIIKNKDGTETKIEVADGATVTIKDKQGKTIAKAGPGTTTPATPAPASDPDRVAAKYVLSLGGAVRVGGKNDEIKTVAALPQERFTLDHVVYFGNTQVTDAVLVNFKDCKNLSVIALSHTQATDAGLANFKDCKNLKAISLNGTQVTDAGLANFKDYKNLEHINLSHTQVTDAGLASLKDCKSLKIFHVEKTKVTLKGLEEFHSAVPGCTIYHDGGTIKPTPVSDPDRVAAEYVLSLGGGVRVTGKEGEIKAAANLPQERFTLDHVYLGGKQVTDAGLVNFKDCKNLSVISLSGAQVTDAGLVNFKDCKNLGEIGLSHTKVTDAGLANFEDCKNLRAIYLNGTQVTGAGLANFKDSKNLEYINLSHTQVTDAGLASLKDCKSLKTFHVEKTKVTLKGLEEFHTAVPGCTIHHDGGTIPPKK